MRGPGQSMAKAGSDEAARLVALSSYDVLDTPREAHFEALASLAARLCDTPMAVITLIDQHRQWFKSEVGLHVRETPRSIAFCAYTIEGEGLFQVTDTATDSRFVNNPLVTGEPRLRFYAGVPLQVQGGHRLGALAVLDRRPRQLTAQQEEDLNNLARQVVLVLEEHRFRLLAEAAAAQAKGQSDSLLMIAGRVARLGAWELDIERQSVTWSDVVADIHGMPRSTAPNLDDALSFYVQPDRAILTQAVDDCLRDGTPFDLELILQPAGSGPPRWVRSIGEAVRDVGGGITHLRGACQDITERKAAEQQRDALEHQLRQSQKLESIGTLAGGIAHDFNNILGAILGNVALVQDAVAADAVARQALATISNSAQRARSLVQQILAFGRQQATQRQTQVLRPLVEQAVDLLQSTLPANITLATRFTDADVWAEVDGNQLQQVLINLCTNSWHAMPAGGGRITVGLDAQAPGPRPQPLQARSGPFAHLWVEDDGCGMSIDAQGRIFEPFFTTKPVGQGTGLGLSAVHGIVVAHGGTIDVESEPGAGSLFDIYLPACAAPADDRAIKPIPAAQAARLEGLRVVCVDDDLVMLTTMQALLEREGCAVLAFVDARQALERVQHAPVALDLLVTDHSMPVMDGMVLAREVSRLSPELPIIMASGFLSDELCEQAARLGVRATVQKERTVEDLVKVVRDVIALRDASADRQR